MFSLFGTRVLIRALASKGYGQIIRDDGPSSHHIKHGTPTMGGIIFILAAILGYLFAHLVTGNAVTASALLVIGLVVALGFIGFLDDWLKVSRQNSRGLPGRYKLLGQAIAAGVFGYLGLQFADKDSLTPISEYLSGVRETTIYLGPALVVIFIIIMVMSASNGVNLTDGLDGLATGASIMTFLGFCVDWCVGVWAKLCSERNSRLLCGSRSTRSCSPCCSICWRMYRFLVVEHSTGKDLYGGYRFARLGWSDSWTCRNFTRGIAVNPARWIICNHHNVSLDSNLVLQNQWRKACI
jgi:hypothetical protein